MHRHQFMNVYSLLVIVLVDLHVSDLCSSADLSLKLNIVSLALDLIYFDFRHFLALYKLLLPCYINISNPSYPNFVTVSHGISLTFYWVISWRRKQTWGMCWDKLSWDAVLPKLLMWKLSSMQKYSLWKQKNKSMQIKIKGMQVVWISLRNTFTAYRYPYKCMSFHPYITRRIWTQCTNFIELRVITLVQEVLMSAPLPHDQGEVTILCSFL